MHLYLPIAGLSVNILVIIGLGGVVGLLSGMFGVGGGFLTTPLLIFYGIPPAVAVASSAPQLTGASVSGVLAHRQRGGVDVQMGSVLVAGGAIGAIFGGFIFQALQARGQIDMVVGMLYVVLLGGIGITMGREAIGSIVASHTGAKPVVRTRRHHPLIASLPGRWRFYKSGLYISPLAPLMLGLATGMITALMGIGGGFILVPAMIYLLGMSTRVVVGTSLFQILFVTIATTMTHALTTHAVDIVLATLLLIGSVTGAQVGVRLAQKVKPEYLRLVLAFMVLTVAFRMALGLTWRPEEIYTVQPL
jgi:uncharacterized membrane protein YfcA